MITFALSTNIFCEWNSKAQIQGCMTDIDNLSESDRLAVDDYHITKAMEIIVLDYDNELTLFHSITKLTNLKKLHFIFS